MQAIIHEEDTTNIQYAFEDVTTVCRNIGKFELKRQLIQIQKDYAGGVEKARKSIFPLVRSVQDYFHMKQAVRPKFQTHLKERQAINAKRKKKA